jgi:hypothetical protein
MPSRFIRRPAVVVYDRLYRAVHRLDQPGAQVGPALRVALGSCRRRRVLLDDTVLAAGCTVGILHLNNERIVRLHTDGLQPMGVGLEFRRMLVTSLHLLAARAAERGPLGDVTAFEATTIFHRGLRRLGFQPERDGRGWSRLVAAYQRALLASLHPAGSLRVRPDAYGSARRLWLTRPALLERYGTVSRAAAGG